MDKEKWAVRLARRTEGFHVARAVTQVLALTERPDVISFAGGLPDPGTFLLDRVEESTHRVLSTRGGEALNYGPTRGYLHLRHWIAEQMRDWERVELDPDEILVTSGGIEALSLVAMALLEPGSTVLVGAPSYLAALHVFRCSQAEILSVEVDSRGMKPDALQDLLEGIGRGDPPRLLYLIPSFQNPSGVTLDLERRRRIVALCADYGVPIVEDHAYANLRYQGAPLPSLKRLWPEGVIFIHTFSKIFAPGVRLGWVAAGPDLVSTLALCKIGTDQCSSTLGQRVVHDFASRGGIDEQIRRAIPVYRRKRDALLAELNRQLSGRVEWTVPEGGFYVWLRLPPGSNSEQLLREAIEAHRVAFVAGTPFFADGRGQEFARLSFSFLREEDIAEGVSRLSSVLANQG